MKPLFSNKDPFQDKSACFGKRFFDPAPRPAQIIDVVGAWAFAMSGGTKTPPLGSTKRHHDSKTKRPPPRPTEKKRFPSAIRTPGAPFRFPISNFCASFFGVLFAFLCSAKNSKKNTGWVDLNPEKPVIKPFFENS